MNNHNDFELRSPYLSDSYWKTTLGYLCMVQVLQEIFDVEKNIELLKICIQEKDAPMQVAQTRMATRTHRPKIEGCRDLVQHRYRFTRCLLAITVTICQRIPQIRPCSKASCLIDGR